MGVGSALVELMLESAVGRIILRYPAQASDYVRKRIASHIRDDIEVVNAEAHFRGASGPPTPVNLEIKLRSRTPADANISALSLRVGFSEKGMTIRNFTWSKTISKEPPDNIDLLPIEGKTDRTLNLEFILPHYLYFIESQQRIYIGGSITLATAFGEVELPVGAHTTIYPEDVESLSDTRAFFQELEVYVDQDSKE